MWVAGCRCQKTVAQRLGLSYIIPMPTLYIENVPDDLYDAIRAKAKAKRKSIAAEVMVVLEQNFPTAKELKARREFLRRVKLSQAARPPGTGPFPSTEEMQREDRLR